MNPKTDAIVPLPQTIVESVSNGFDLVVWEESLFGPGIVGESVVTAIHS